VIELLLLEHDEADKPLQFVPLILIAAGVAAVIWHLARPGPATLSTLQVVMVLCRASSAFSRISRVRPNSCSI
jgi:hypothetical protein